MANERTGAPVATTVGRLPRRRLADLAYEEIRARIVSGGIPMGTRLNEVHLARELGTSRAPVREAIRRLSEEGLTTERAHIGAVVRELDADALVDLYNVRLALEKTAIRLATRHRMRTDDLRTLTRDMIGAAQRGDHVLLAEHEVEFHALIWERCGNEMLARLLRGLQGQLLMAIALDDAGFPDLEKVAREHEPVIEAIEGGDERAAAAAIERHILFTIGNVIERLGGRPDELLTEAPCSGCEAQGSG